MRETGRISLDPRLSMIARLVGHCQRCVDIGCDHGRLGAFLLQFGQCEGVVMSDISEPSLRKARTLMEALGLSDRVAFCVTDGVPALQEPVDVAVIAGMGGTTIAQILRDGRERLGEARLVLQPNVAAFQLRQALSEVGYAITDERVARDGRRSYVVIVAEPGASSYSERQLEVGPVLLDRLPDELSPYARFRLRVAEKALAGAEHGGDDAQRQALRREIDIWREVCACLRR